MLLTLHDNDINGTPRTFEVSYDEDGNVRKIIFNGQNRTRLIMSIPTVMEWIESEVEKRIELEEEDRSFYEEFRD